MGKKAILPKPRTDKRKPTTTKRLRKKDMRGLAKNKNDEYKDLMFPLAGVRYDAWTEYKMLNKYFPELGNYDGPLNKQIIIRYINYFYSVKTPLLKKFREDVVSRKKEALRLAAKDVDEDYSKKLEYYEEGLHKLKEPVILEAVVRFLSMQRHNLYSSIVIAENRFSELQEVLLDPITKETGTKEEGQRLAAIKNKSQLQRDLDETKRLLEGYYKEFFQDNDAVEAYQNTPAFMISPEIIAKTERPV
jgi:hypothetical protein